MTKSYSVYLRRTQGHCAVKGCDHLWTLWRGNYGREQRAERRRHPGLTGEGENQTKIGFLVTNVHNLFILLKQ